MTRISVAMATYNGAAHLQAQLDSITAQTRPPFELLIGDDGSSDHSIAIAEAFARTAPFPVRVHRNPSNLGFANNFLATAERCTGDWIAFCDQDDAWYPDKLARVAAEIEARGTSDLVMVCHVADVVDDRLVKTGRRLPDVRRTHVTGPNSHYGFWCIGGCVMTVRADLVRGIDWRRRPADDFLPAERMPGGRADLPHDKWMCILANALGNTLFLAEPLGCYRRHDAALTGSHDAVPIAERMRKAAATGADYYEFRARIGRETAEALRNLAEGLEPDKADRMRVGAKRFDALARVQRDRAALYSARGLAARLSRLGRLVAGGAYFGDPVSSIGGASLAKDLAFTLRGGRKG